MEKIEDHVALALTRLPSQFAGKPKLRAFISALIRPFQRLEDAQWQVYTLTSIDTATGLELEQIGILVGEPPSGLDDEVYRRRIRARIAVNRSKGRAEDLYSVALAVLGSGSGVTVQIQRSGAAEARVDLTGVVDEETAGVAFELMQAAASSGVRIHLVYTPSVLADTFRLDVGPGLDDGHLAGDF